MRQYSTLAVLSALAILSQSCANAEEGRVKILQTITLPDRVEDVKIRELSALAYDPNSNTLWAASDQGELLGFAVHYDGQSVADIKLVHSFDFDHELKNAEGMEYVPPRTGENEGRLLVAYEDGPSIVSFSLTGVDARTVALPPPLSMLEAYAEENSRLESVTIDVDGQVLTAPEEALAGRPDTEHEIFHMDGRIFKFPTFQPHRSNLKAIEHLSDGKILILERTRDEADISTMRLRLLDPTSCSSNTYCKVVELTPEKVRDFVGNFEGLTQLKDNMFAAITDSKPKNGEANKLVIFKLVR
jgi:Esterase-like activity of phytase